MDLGRSRLRKVGINNLHCAVHPQHGVIWTDGKAIYLAPIQVEGRQVQNATSVKLGEFENVTSVHWSSTSTEGGSCHMCVVHQQNVTVWRVSGLLPKLSFKQVRKINVRAIPQGCLWNPSNDVLCLLSRHQCSFYYRHDSNKGSYAFPSLENGSISCGCWSPDGKKLVLCVGTALLIYRWSDVSVSVSDFAATAWRVPGLEGQVTSIAPVLKDSVVVSTEIPLESLCKQQDMFKVPDANGDSKPDDGIIRPNKSASATHNLFNLQQNKQVVPEASSSLTMIHLHDGSRDPVKLSSVPLKGVLTPDILMYEKSSQCVVVGSNSQSQLHIYALLEKHLAYCGDIQLDKGQRPKGLCSMPTYFDDHGAALLILVGQRENEDTALLSPSTDSEFKLSLKYIILKAGYDHQSRTNGRGNSIKSKSTGNVKSPGLVKSESMKEHRIKNISDSNLRGRSDSVKNDHQAISRAKSPEGQVRLPEMPTGESSTEPQLRTKPPTDHIVHKTKMIEELSDSSDPPNPDSIEVETVPFSSRPPSFDNSKLTDKYELHAAPRSKSKAMKEKRNSLHNSPPRDSRGRETSRETDKKKESSPLRQLTVGKYQDVERTSQEISHTDSFPSQKHKTSSKDRDSKPSQKHERFAESKTSIATTNEKHSSRDNHESIIPRVMSSSSQTDRESPRHFSSLHTGHLPCITEAKSEMSDVNSQSLGMNGADSVDGAKEDTLSDLGFGSSQHSADSTWDNMERQVKSQKDSIEALQRRIEALSSSVEESSCVFPTKYQDMGKPEMVEIYCEKPEGTETKRFLLDNGRLQLEPLKLSFGLVTVELWLDGIPCVLGANIDGYIPMKFSPSTKLHISGLPADRQSQS